MHTCPRKVDAICTSSFYVLLVGVTYLSVQDEHTVLAVLFCVGGARKGKEGGEQQLPADTEDRERHLLGRPLAHPAQAGLSDQDALHRGPVRRMQAARLGGLRSAGQHCEACCQNRPR